MLQSQCCVCFRIKIPGLDIYGEAADGILRDASHTYCPPCAASARLELVEAAKFTR